MQPVRPYRDQINLQLGSIKISFHLGRPIVSVKVGKAVFVKECSTTLSFQPRDLLLSGKIFFIV